MSGRVPSAAAAALVGIALALALSWAPSFAAPFGDNHEGRVDARFALHVANARDEGLSGSGWVSSTEPYGESYAHHPPGPNAVQLALSYLPTEGEEEVRLFPYAMGLVTLLSAAWLLRVVGVSWPATVGAIAVLVTLPMFWTYGRLLWDIPILFAVPAAILSIDATPSRRRLLFTCALLTVAATMSWIAAATTIAFVALRLLRNRADHVRRTLALALAALLGLALTAGWILAATEAQELADQVAFRTSGGEFTVIDFVRRQAVYLRDLYAPWLLLLVPLGLWRGRGDARAVVLLSGALGLAFVVALPNGSFIHDYWSYPLLVTVTVASGLAFDAFARRRGLEVTVLSGVLAGAFVLVLGFGKQAEVRFEHPQAAGALAKRHDPAPGQEVAWTANGVATARWLSLYWDRSAVVLTGDNIDEAPGDDLVLVKLPLPQELDDVEPVDADGPYAVVRVDDLRQGQD